MSNSGFTVEIYFFDLEAVVLSKAIASIKRHREDALEREKIKYHCAANSSQNRLLRVYNSLTLSVAMMISLGK